MNNGYFNRPRTHGNLIFHYGGLPLVNLEKYDRKANILAPNKNEMEVGVQVYLPKEPRTPGLCSRPRSYFSIRVLKEIQQ